MNLKKSLEFVRNKRNIQPNIYFFYNLIKYEYNIYKENSIMIWEYMNKSEQEYKDFILQFKIILN
jgi:hypothetical protein